MGLINIYNKIDNSHKTVHANGKIKDVFPELKLENCLFLKEGSRLTSDYEIKEEDILYLRITPAAIETVAVAIAVAVAVTAVGVTVGKGIYEYKQNTLLKQQQLENSKALTSTDVNKLPYLKGASNTVALGKTIPMLIGRMYFTPYLLNTGHYSIEGKDGTTQYWNAILICGYNNIRLNKISIGDYTLKTFNDTTDSQDGYYDFDGDYKGLMEIRSIGDLCRFGCDQKCVGTTYGAEIKHDHDEDAEELIEQADEYAQRIEVCIQFDGLRQYDSETDNWIKRSVQVNCYWSNNADDDNPTWNAMTFEGSSTETSETWSAMTSAEKTAALSAGYIAYSTSEERTSSQKYVRMWVSTSADYTIDSPIQFVDSQDAEVVIPDGKKRTITVTDNIISRKTNQTIRFVASKTFTAAESYGKKITVKLVRVTPKLDGVTANETVVLQYINTYCYDNIKSSSESLYPCKPLETPYRDKTTRIGIRVEATDSSISVLDNINVIMYGLARTWSGTSWSSSKQITRNPAAWILEVLTSKTHLQSRFLDSEIDLNSLGALYEYCEDNSFYADGVITEGKQKRDIISDLLSLCHTDMILDEEGLLSFVTDKKETTPVALINAQNVKSITYAKSFERQIKGLKTTYTDRNSWESITEYFMKSDFVYTWGTDSITEFTPEFCTTHDHAYKLAQRKLRQAILQPRTITVDVGMEGDYYPLFSTVMLQMEQFKQGLNSSVVHNIILSGDQITGVEIADKVEIVKNYTYGLIIQTTNRGFVYARISSTTGTGKVNVLKFTESITNDGSIVYGSICSFGLLDNGSFTKVTNVMKIVGVEPSGDNHGFTLTLKDYDEDIYEYGVIPSYTPNLTKRPVCRTQNTLTITQVTTAAKQAADNATKRLYSNHIIKLYKASDNEITETGITSAATYNFDSNAFSFDNEEGANGWSLTFDAALLQTTKVYEISATAIGQTVSVSIPSGNWSTPLPYGHNGYSSRVLQLYIRSESKPVDLPFSFTQNFYDAEIDATEKQLNGWKTSYPEIDGNKPVWLIACSITSQTDSITIDAGRWSTPVKIAQDVEVTQEEIQEMIDRAAKLSAPVVYASTTFGQISVDEDNIALATQSMTTTIHVLQADEELSFGFGEITVPEGFSVSHVGNVLTITVAEGAVVTAGSINIPIRYYPYLSMDEYVDEDGNLYGDEDGTPYGYYNTSDTPTIYNLGFGYSQTKTARYLNGISSVSEIPTALYLGDYFTWTGVDTTSPLSLDGKFLKGALYKWNGTTWKKDTSTAHIQSALQEIFEDAKTDLTTNNSEVVQMFKKIVSSQAILENLIVTGSALIQKLQAVDIYADKFESYDSKAQEYAEEAQIDAEDTLSTLFQKGGIDSTTHTLIEGSEITTGLINADQITTNVIGNKNFEVAQGQVKDLDATLEEKADSSDVTSLQSDVTNTICDEQRIYCRIALVKGSTITCTAPTEWITESGSDVDVNVWTTSQLASQTTSGGITTDYIVFSCLQFRTYGQKSEETFSCTTPAVNTESVFDLKNGFLKTNVIDTDTLLANYASLSYLEGGTAKFKGKIEANSLLTNENYNIPILDYFGTDIDDVEIDLENDTAEEIYNKFNALTCYIPYYKNGDATENRIKYVWFGLCYIVSQDGKPLLDGFSRLAINQFIWTEYGNGNVEIGLTTSVNHNFYYGQDTDARIIISQINGVYTKNSIPSGLSSSFKITLQNEGLTIAGQLAVRNSIIFNEIVSNGMYGIRLANNTNAIQIVLGTTKQNTIYELLTARGVNTSPILIIVGVFYSDRKYDMYPAAVYIAYDDSTERIKITFKDTTYNLFNVDLVCGTYDTARYLKLIF